MSFYSCQKISLGRSSLTLILVLVSAVHFLPLHTAHAASLTVTKFVDTNDGSCDATDCSLREAVIAANTSPGADTIILDAGTYTLTITHTTDINEDASATGDLDITDDLTIAGKNVLATTIQAGTDSVPVTDRVFQILPNTAVMLQGLQITGGVGSPMSASGHSVGGGIVNAGTLSLQEIGLYENTAGLTSVPLRSDPSPSGDGGGIYNTGMLTLATVFISENASENGAGIYNASSGSVEGSVTSANNVARLLAQPHCCDSTDYSTGVGGGLYNAGTMLISGGRIENNDGAKGGGGIYNTGMLTVTKALNVTANKGGGVSNSGVFTAMESADISSNKGSGVSNSGTLTLTGTTVTMNSGVGIYNSGAWVRDNNDNFVYHPGTASITTSTITNNRAPEGAGITNYGALTLTLSLVSQNYAYMAYPDIGRLPPGSARLSYGVGAGMYNVQVKGSNVPDSTLTVINSTISDNIAEDMSGGLHNAGGTTTFINTTIAGNQARGLEHPSGGGVTVLSGTTVLAWNTLIGFNEAQVGSGPDCAGVLTSRGYNLIMNLSGCVVDGDTAGNIIGRDPLLSPLADNGGPTESRALHPASPAIDAGNPEGCRDQDNQLLLTDQRGSARPQGQRCDIGAFESDLFRQPLLIYLPLIQ